MANIKSSKKAIRVIEKRTEINKSRRSRIKTFLRKVNDAISSGVMEDAKKAFVEFESELMKGVQNGIYKKNSASRKLFSNFGFEFDEVENFEYARAITSNKSGLEGSDIFSAKMYKSCPSSNASE